MNKLIGNFKGIEWTEVAEGMSEKRITLGETVIRLLRIESKFSDKEWCTNGHVGYVAEGTLGMNINGENSELATGSVFRFEDGVETHRHYPYVDSGRVLLLLVEEG